MNKILYAFVIIATLTSCAESYSVQGSSSISALDGSKLYLKAIKDNELRNIDSCDVVHGKFRFAGLLDTVCMANLFMDDEGIMPVVLEQGEISIRIDKATQTVYGTPLNDKLYEFIDLHNQLLASPKFPFYNTAYYKVLPFIVELRNRGANKDENEIETCLDSLYGVMLLRLQKKTVSPDTQHAVKEISTFIGMLSDYYKKDKEEGLKFE